MDYLDLLSLVLAVFALLVSLLVFWDNRKKTQIMKAQLKLLQEETEGKREIRNAIKIIDSIHDKIRGFQTAFDLGDYAWVYIRLMERLHDSGRNILPLRIKVMAINEYKPQSFGSFDVFRKKFEKMAQMVDKGIPINSKGVFIEIGDVEIDFESTPTLEVDRIHIGEYVSQIYSLFLMSNELQKIEKLVNLYDNLIIRDICDTYSDMLNSFFNAIRTEHRFKINLKMKSRQILEEPLKMIALDSWKRVVSKMQENILPRLHEIKRQLLESY